jgi:hypothetical protein
MKRDGGPGFALDFWEARLGFAACDDHVGETVWINYVAGEKDISGIYLCK